MQLRSEGSSIRFVAISLLIFTAASFIGYWYWSPYYAADQIKNAIESGDTARMSKFIDFPKVRLNIQRQINNQIDLKLREFQSQPVTTKNLIVGPVLPAQSNIKAIDTVSILLFNVHS